MEWKKFKTGEIIEGKEDTNRLGIKIIENEYSVKPNDESQIGYPPADLSALGGIPSRP